MTAPPLATRRSSPPARGRLVLVFLCAVAFLDFVDTSIVNVALPSIQRDLHFSVQNLQWVVSGYIVTYGGFLLLGGRIADLLGRRRIAGGGHRRCSALASLAGGSRAERGDAGRRAPGPGARRRADVAGRAVDPHHQLQPGHRPGARRSARGAPSAGLASAVGVFLGGVLSAGPGWRWVFFVNLPVCARGPGRRVPADRRRPTRPSDESIGLDLRHAGRGPRHRRDAAADLHAWCGRPTTAGARRATIGELAGAAALLVAFVVNEARGARTRWCHCRSSGSRGWRAADAVQVIAMAGFYSMFFFVTLYMQNVLGFSPTRAGAAYVPVAVGWSRSPRSSAPGCSITRLGTPAADRGGRADRGRRGVLAVPHPRARLLSRPTCFPG